MNVDTTCAILLDCWGAGWFAIGTYQWPSAWRAARAGHLATAGNLAAINAMWLAVIALFTWPPAGASGTRSATTGFGLIGGHDMVVRLGVLTALATLMAALILTLAVGARSRATEEEHTA